MVATTIHGRNFPMTADTRFDQKKDFWRMWFCHLTCIRSTCLLLVKPDHCKALAQGSLERRAGGHCSLLSHSIGDWIAPFADRERGRSNPFVLWSAWWENRDLAWTQVWLEPPVNNRRLDSIHYSFGAINSRTSSTGVAWATGCCHS